MKNSFKTLLKEKKFLVGVPLILDIPEIVEICALAGVDFVLIDQEKGGVGVEKPVNLVRAAESFGIVPLLRVKSLNETEIKHALDIGVAGIEVPIICTAKKAEWASRYAKFPPVGVRGACPGVRANKYDWNDKSYYTKSNEDIAVCATIESLEGWKNIEEILKVEGIDAITVRIDILSSLLGKESTNNSIKSKISEIIASRSCSEKAIGVAGIAEESILGWKSIGISYILLESDREFVVNAVQNIVCQANKLLY